MRPGPNHIGTTGAAGGDFLGYDPDIDEYRPMVPSGGTAPTTALVPWTTTLSDGTPDLMWDDDDNLMMVEAPR